MPFYGFRYLCAKAYDGGKDGYAFNIVENGGGKWDGSLITDSKGFPAAILIGIYGLLKVPHIGLYQILSINLVI